MGRYACITQVVRSMRSERFSIMGHYEVLALQPGGFCDVILFRAAASMIPPKVSDHIFN
jgi:hypothetical protein